MGSAREFGVGIEHLDARGFVNCARLAEELGYGVFWVPEDPFFRGAFSIASAVASNTTSVRIGIGVVNPYTRHPVVTAMELAALEEISGGRAILGMGASLKAFIEGQLNLSYVKPARAIRESVEIIRGLCNGDELSYDGAVFQARNARFNFKPLRSAAQVHLGVLGPRNLELAGEIADGLLLSIMTSPPYVRYAMDHVRRGAERAGRSLDGFEVSAYLLISISEDEKAARDALRPLIAMMFGIVGSELSDHPMFSCAGLPAEDVKAFSDRFAKGELPVNLVTDWMIETFAIAGTPEQCREGLSKIIDAGVTTPVAFEIPGIRAEDTIRGVRNHLMPYFL